VIRVRLAGEAEAARFFASYSELLEKKYAKPASVMKRANSLFFDTGNGGAFIRCSARDCLLGEGATRAQVDSMVRAMGWPAARAAAALPVRPSRQPALFVLAGVPLEQPLSQGLSAR